MPNIIFFIQAKHYYGRKSNGEYAFENEEFIVPSQMVSPNPLWPYMDEIISSKLHQMNIGSKLVILKHPTYQGYFGKVVSVDEKNKQKLRIKVQKNASEILEKPNLVKDQPKNYVPLEKVCHILKLEIPTAMILLDSLRVNLDSKAKSVFYDKFGDYLDIGLNLINQQTLKIVPELIICKKLEKGRAYTRNYLELLELSVEAVELLKSYKENFGCIIETINNRPKAFDIPYRATDFKSTDKDPNVEIIKVYTWLLGQKTSTLAQVPINSKVFITYDDLCFLFEFFIVI